MWTLEGHAAADASELAHREAASAQLLDDAVLADQMQRADGDEAFRSGAGDVGDSVGHDAVAFIDQTRQQNASEDRVLRLFVLELVFESPRIRIRPRVDHRL